MLDPKRLPIYEKEEEIVEAVHREKCVVVVSPTGTGKTTQIPQMLLRANIVEWPKMIGITQPRRISAVGVALRVAEEMGEKIGDIVGYKIRFDEKISHRTILKFMTDGILLMEHQHDPLLEEYTLIMVDEAHERTLNIDFTLGILKSILKKREDFKVLISSATINPCFFSEYFDDAPIIEVKAPLFPVEIKYTPPKKNTPKFVIEKILKVLNDIFSSSKDGDVLIFLSGEAEINECIQKIKELNRGNIVILPLFARLSNEEQRRVFEDFGEKRKIVVATNIAETSITIDGIKYVIDNGFAKINDFIPETSLSLLKQRPISKASAEQRKGRGGRVCPGICYRIYSPETFKQMPSFTKEEILRTDLSEIILRLLILGIKNVERFDFPLRPSKKRILASLKILQELGAITKKRELTEMGKKMSIFPMEPKYSRMIVEAEKRGVLEDTIIVTSFLSVKGPFVAMPSIEEEDFVRRELFEEFGDENGDLTFYINLFKGFVGDGMSESFCKFRFLDFKTMMEIYNIKNQIMEIALKSGFYNIEPSNGNENIIRAVAAGLPKFILRKKKRGLYSNRYFNNIEIHPSSSLFNERPHTILAGEIVSTTRTYARHVSVIRKGFFENSGFKKFHSNKREFYNKTFTI